LPSANGDAEAADTGGFAPNAFIRIGSDGHIILSMSYVEMGQGTYAAIPMLIAAELEVDLTQVRLEHAPPNEKLYGNPLLGGLQGNRQFEWPYGRRGSRCARPVRSPEPCSCRQRQSAGMSIRRPAARKAVKYFTRRLGEVQNMANLPPRPPT
jgi:hypothetical protein